MDSNYFSPASVGSALLDRVFLVLADREVEIGALDYTPFVAPGILTMTIIQHSFANTSSSILISKVQGNIVDTLVTPLRPIEVVISYMIGGMSRGVIVSVSIMIVIFPLLASTSKPCRTIYIHIISKLDAIIVGILMV